MGVRTVGDLANTLEPDSTIEQFSGVIASAEREDANWRGTARGILRRNRGRGLAGKRYAGKPEAQLLLEFEEHLSEVDRQRSRFCEVADGALVRGLALTRGRREVALHPMRDGESVPCFLAGHRQSEELEKRRKDAIEGEARSAKAARVIGTGDTERVAEELSQAIGQGDRDLAGSLVEGIAERWKKGAPGVLQVELGKIEASDFFGIRALDARAEALEALRARVGAFKGRDRDPQEGKAVLDSAGPEDLTLAVGPWVE